MEEKEFVPMTTDEVFAVIYHSLYKKEAEDSKDAPSNKEEGKPESTDEEGAANER